MLFGLRQIGEGEWDMNPNNTCSSYSPEGRRGAGAGGALRPLGEGT